MRKAEIDPELLKKYLEEKRTNAQIAELFGVSKKTITEHIRRNGFTGMRNRKKEEKIEPVEAGYNADRHKCRTCTYRAKNFDKYTKRCGCNFISIEGHSRGCKVEDCNVYKKGKRISIKRQLNHS